MKELRGKTAFVTGGASGIGFGMAEAFGRQGMNVVIADIEKSALDNAVRALQEKQIRAVGVIADVADRNSLREAALASISAFGKVHVLCNNAGVVIDAPMDQVSDGDWDWIIDVNLKGVVNGMNIFTPLIKSHGEGGHIVNTASFGGLVSGANSEAYSGTKAAVIMMTEGWALELAEFGIGASVLCPGLVATRIMDSRRNRSDVYGDAKLADTDIPGSDKAAVAGGTPPLAIGERVVEAIVDNDLYIFPHVEFAPLFEARSKRIMEAFTKSAQSPAMNALPPRELPEVLLRRL